jgi:hypothetical protein
LKLGGGSEKKRDLNGAENERVDRTEGRQELF